MKPVASFLLCALICLLPLSLPAATFSVDTDADSFDDNTSDGLCRDLLGRCSLRAAIMQANSFPDADDILLPTGTYLLALEGADENDGRSGDLDIISELVITGAGQDSIIDAGGLDRAFDIQPFAVLTLQNLAVRNGSVLPAGSGGCFLVGEDAAVSLEQVAITGCAAGDGGGIFVSQRASLALDHVSISGSAALYGGGIRNGGSITGDRVSITANSATADGGGLYASGENDNSTHITRSLIAGNEAGSGVVGSGAEGGGVFNGGNGSFTEPVGSRLMFENVTVSDNSADNGAGIHLQTGSITYLVNCTVIRNSNTSTTTGAGLRAPGAAAFDFLNTLVAENQNTFGLSNCFQMADSSSGNTDNPVYFDQNVPFGHNLSDGGCFSTGAAASLIVADALIADSLTAPDALAGTGTYPLLAGSPAIDAADPENFAADDVFGTIRPLGAAADIGAHEAAAVPDPAGTPPTAPRPIAPASGSLVASTDVTFTWQVSTDPDGGDVGYLLELSTDSRFITDVTTYAVDSSGNGVLVGGFGSAVLLLLRFGWAGRNRWRKTGVALLAGLLLAATLMVGCGGGGGSDRVIGTLSFEVVGLDVGTTYFWRVTARDQADETSAPSAVWSFTTPDA